MEKFEITIPGKPQYITMVRLFTASIASVAGFDVECVDDIKNSISEACKLISCHGQQGYSDKYTICCEMENHFLEVTVIDDCDRHSLEKRETLCKSCPNDGNLGIVVIKSLMNDVDYGMGEDGRKFVKMVKKL